MGKLITSLGNPFVATENNVIDTVNNLLDSKQNKLEFDSTPTENSINPVTSGGVYKSIYEAKTSMEESINSLKSMLYDMDDQLRELLDDYHTVKSK
jgi:hypothetical protein